MKEDVLLRRAIRLHQKAYSKHETWKNIISNQQMILFVTKWQDKLENLYLVWNEVLKCDECPNIISYKIENKCREDEYDVYILTEDNLKYREVFYKTLLRMREEYSQKQLTA